MKSGLDHGIDAGRIDLRIKNIEIIKARFLRSSSLDAKSEYFTGLKENIKVVLSRMQEPFQEQFNLLLNQFRTWGEVHGVYTAQVKANIDTLLINIFDPGYSGSQENPAYFENMKRNLEKIFLALQNETTPLAKRKDLYNNLCKTFAVCAPGLSIHIQNIAFSLNTTVSVRFWLLCFRTELIQVYANIDNVEKHVSEGNSVHTEGFFAIDAENQGWTSALPTKEINDAFRLHVYIDDEDLKKFRRFFESEYAHNPMAVRACIYKNINKLVEETFKGFGFKIDEWNNINKDYGVFIEGLGHIFKPLDITNECDFLELNDEDTQFKLRMNHIVDLLCAQVLSPALHFDLDTKTYCELIPSHWFGHRNSLKRKTFDFSIWDNIPTSILCDVLNVLPTQHVNTLLEYISNEKLEALAKSESYATSLNAIENSDKRIFISRKISHILSTGEYKEEKTRNPAELSNNGVTLYSQPNKIHQKSALIKLLQAMLDDDPLTVSNILTTYPEFIFVKLEDYGITEIESQYTWLRYLTEDESIFSMAQKLKLIDMLKIMLPHYLKALEDAQVSDDKDQILKLKQQWIMPDLTTSPDEQESLQEKYIQEYLLAPIEALKTDTTIKVDGTAWNPETNVTEAKIDNASEATLKAMRKLREELFKPKAIKDCIDINQLLIAAYTVYDINYRKLEEDQKNAYPVWVIGLIQSLSDSSLGKMFCQGLSSVVNHNLQIGASAQALKLNMDQSFYRLHPDSQVGLGYTFLCTIHSNNIRTGSNGCGTGGTEQHVITKLYQAKEAACIELTHRVQQHLQVPASALGAPASHGGYGLFSIPPAALPVWITDPAARMGIDPHFLYHLHQTNDERYTRINLCIAYLCNHHQGILPHAAMTLEEALNETTMQQLSNLNCTYMMVEYKLLSKEESKSLTEEERLVIVHAYGLGYATGTLEDCQAKRAALDTYRANHARVIRPGCM